jgi:hypothetical protein
MTARSVLLCIALLIGTSAVAQQAVRGKTADLDDLAEVRHVVSPPRFEARGAARSAYEEVRQLGARHDAQIAERRQSAAANESAVNACRQSGSCFTITERKRDEVWIRCTAGTRTGDLHRFYIRNGRWMQHGFIGNRTWNSPEEAGNSVCG